MNRTILMICGAAVCALLLMYGVSLYLKQRQNALLTQRPEHGISFLLEVDLSKANGGTNNLALLKQALHQRCNLAGVRLFWEPISNSRIQITTTTRNPGQAEGLTGALFERGFLEFRLVHESSDKLVENGEVPLGFELLQHEVALPQGPKRIEKLLVRKAADRGLSGNLTASATVTRGRSNEPQIYFTLRPEAAAAFSTVTSENKGRRLAIIVDDRLYSAPTITSPVTTGKGMITGQFNLQEALEIAIAIGCPLPLPVKMVEMKPY